MGKHLAAEAREICIQVYRRLRSVRKASELCGIPKSTIHRWANESRRVIAPRLARKATQEVRVVIKETIDASPFSTASDVAAQVRSRLQTQLSARCAHRWIKRLGYSLKRSQASYVRPGLDQERREFAERWRDASPSGFISVDETAVYVDMRPLRGYAPVGTRLRHGQPSASRRRLTLLLAVSANGVVLSRMLVGAANGAAFASFVGDLAAVAPADAKRLLLDNASIHKTQAVRKAAHDAGLELAYLPPYTPQFQPVEHVFSALKHKYRRACAARATPDVLPTEPEVRRRVQDCLDQVNAMDWRPTFEACWARVRAPWQGP